MTLADETRGELRAIAGGRDHVGRTDECTVDKSGKLVLPAIPAPDDHPGLCAWLSNVFNLDHRCPVVSVMRTGPHGPRGMAFVNRAGDAPQIVLEPISIITNPPRLIEALATQKLGRDGIVRDFKAGHCREIAHVVSMLAQIGERVAEVEQAAGIIGDLIQAGEEQAGFTTYGPGRDRYLAASALVRGTDELTGRSVLRPPYLIDSSTGELVVAVSELNEIARRYLGSSVRMGWLQSAIEALGWSRITLEGWEQPGMQDRGRHRRVHAYRGRLPEGGAG